MAWALIEESCFSFPVIEEIQELSRNSDRVELQAQALGRCQACPLVAVQTQIRASASQEFSFRISKLQTVIPRGANRDKSWKVPSCQSSLMNE